MSNHVGDSVQGRNWLARMRYLGVELPPVPEPAGAYAAAVRTGRRVITSGQLPLVAGSLPLIGRLGEQVSVDDGYQLARAATLGGLAAVDALVGLDAVVRIVRVVGYVASGDEFADQAKVVDGASNLLLEIFGEQGRHARSTIGAAWLPLGAPVEVDLEVEVRI